MKIVHKDINMQIELNCLYGTELIIESEKLFCKYVCELVNGENGTDNDFVISDDDKIISMNKDMQVILEPISLDINDKKFISKLYSHLYKVAYNENNFLNTQSIISQIKSYITKLDFEEDIMIDVEDDLDINTLFKAIGVKMYTSGDSMLENIINYIKISNRLLGKKIFTFVNLRAYLSKEEFTDLLYELSYYHIYLFLIENVERDCVPNMKRYIIDRDYCEI